MPKAAPYLNEAKVKGGFRFVLFRQAANIWVIPHCYINVLVLENMEWISYEYKLT